MDSFVEQIVVKKAETKDNLIRLGYFFGCVAVCFILVIAMNFLPSEFSMIFIGLSFGAIWLTWFLFQNTFILFC